ncbi:MAG: ankyrin repeat domain-containing protein [Ardenticatenaceae bacterium]
MLISAGANVNGILPSWASSVETLDDEPSANDDPTYFVLSFEYDGQTLWLEFDLPETALSLTSDPQVVKMLLDAGADPNLDGRGEPLKLAVEHGEVESVALLLHAGARIPNNSLRSERSLLDTAAKKGYTEIYELLRQHGATHHNWPASGAWH